MERGDHGYFGDGSDHAIFHGRRGRYAQSMAIHAAFAEEMPGLEDRDDGLLALFGQDGELDLPLLNIKYRLRDIALFEDFLVLVKFEDHLPVTDFGEKLLRVKHVLGWLAHNGPPLVRTTAEKYRGPYERLVV